VKLFKQQTKWECRKDPVSTRSSRNAGWLEGRGAEWGLSCTESKLQGQKELSGAWRAQGLQLQSHWRDFGSDPLKFFSFSFLVLEVLGFEFRASHLLGSCFTIWAISSAQVMSLCMPWRPVRGDRWYRDPVRRCVLGWGEQMTLGQCVRRNWLGKDAFWRHQAAKGWGQTRTKVSSLCGLHI
jgi:hypothetical protein